MFKTGGGGVKGRLNNVKKKLNYWWERASLYLSSFFLVENPVVYFGVLVGGWEEELEDLGYIEPIEPNRGAPRATKLVNFNMCRCRIIIKLKTFKHSACLG